MYSFGNIVLLASVSSFIFTFILCKFQGLNLKEELLKVITLFITLLFSISIVAINFNGVQKILILYLATSGLNYFIINRNFRESAIYSLIAYSITIISEIISAIILMVVLKVDINIDKINEYNIILHIMIIAISLILLTFVLKIFKKTNFNSYVKESKKDKVILYLGINLLTIAGVWVYIVFNSNSIGSQIYNVIIVFVFFSTNIALVLFQSNISVKEKLIKNISEEKEKRDMYIDVMENLMDNLKNFKHDYGNSIRTLSGYIENDDKEGAKKFIKSISHISENEKIINYYDVKYIKDPGLKGLIIYKVSEMVKRNLDFSISIDKLNRIDDLRIDILDLSRIIGIIIDNAIEASELSEEKKIEIIILENNLSTEIIISNSFIGTLDIGDIYKNGYSTKGKNRGLGLYSVSKIIDKYPNVNLYTSVNGNICYQKIEIL